MLSADGVRLEFRLADFSGHTSKLELIRKLMDKDNSDIDWHEFFADGFDAYAEYVHARLNPEQKQLERTFKSKGNNPLRPGGSPPKEEAESQAEDEPIKVLDPFSAVANGEAATSDEVIDMRNTTHHITKLDFGRIPGFYI